MTFVGQFLDNVGMYLVLCWAFTYGLVVQRKVQAFTATALYLSLVLFFAMVNWYVPHVRRQAFFCMLLATIVSQAWVANRNTSYWYMAVACMAFGFAFWVLDQYHYVCLPHAYWYQGHAIWHLFCALSTYYLYCYFEL